MKSQIFQKFRGKAQQQQCLFNGHRNRRGYNYPKKSLYCHLITRRERHLDSKTKGKLLSN